MGRTKVLLVSGDRFGTMRRTDERLMLQSIPRATKRGPAEPDVLA